MKDAMNANQVERWLKRDFDIEASPMGRTGHVLLRNPANGRTSILPRHGGRKQIGSGLLNKILKDVVVK